MVNTSNPTSLILAGDAATGGPWFAYFILVTIVPIVFLILIGKRVQPLGALTFSLIVGEFISWFLLGAGLVGSGPLWFFGAGIALCVFGLWLSYREG